MSGSDTQISTVQKSALAYADGNAVEGWLTPTAARITIEIAKLIGVEGRPVCEIGVHHGKFAILLGLLNGARLVGFDLFERQSENIDSGAGDKRLFLRNASLHGLEDVVAVSANSMELGPAEVIESCGGAPVLFSVDGGHTEEITVNDLKIAASSVAEDGVVILDDVFNSSYPGVVSGLFSFHSSSPDALFPFCIGGGKVFLARDRDCADRMRDALARTDLATRSGSEVKISGFCGRDVIVIRARSAAKSARQVVTRTRMWRRIRDKPAGMLVRRVYAMLRYNAAMLRSAPR